MVFINASKEIKQPSKIFNRKREIITELFCKFLAGRMYQRPMMPVAMLVVPVRMYMNEADDRMILNNLSSNITGLTKQIAIQNR